ncbi:MAG: hypothetical protein JOZ22_00965, partial [Acidobacteriia bacterium]|nr:hypothetical protein [Terriglobia bacterium]
EHQPVGPTETGLVQTIADCQWRLSRGPSLEEGVNAWGHQGESGDFDAPSEPLHATLTAAREFRDRPKTFNNLALYLTRIHRIQERALKQLKQIQAERQAREQAQMEEAIVMYKYHKMLGEPYDPREDGFEFSVADIERAIARRERREKAQMAAKLNFNLPQFRISVAKAEAEVQKEAA